MRRDERNNLLLRQQKHFKMNALLPLDANNLDVDEAISRLFVYLRTGGRQITRTDKPIFPGDGENAETPGAVIAALAYSDGHKIEGIEDIDRQQLLTSWLESHFALMARRGKTRGGDYRMSGLRPLHFSVIKPFNPRVRRQDRYLSDFFYNVLHEDPVLYGNSDSILKQFFQLGVQFYGDSDIRIDETKLGSTCDSTLS